MIHVYIDENFAPQLAEGLNVFQRHLNLKEENPFEVQSITERFGKGAKDEEWIPVLGKEQAIIITQDLRIQTTRHQSALYRQYGLGIFFFKPPSKSGFSFWEMVQQVIRRWEEIKSIAIKAERPFAFRCTLKKRGFEPL